MQSMLFLFISMTAIIAQVDWTKVPAHLKFNGLNVITKCVVPGMVALTYDDGVSKYTHQLLDVLKQEKVRASFFVMGVHLAENPSLAKSALQRMWKDGHDIGSHSYDHPYLSQCSDKKIEDQMYRTDELIYKHIGEYPVLMRPPFGDVNQHVVSKLNSMGYKIICWNKDPFDWNHEESPPSTLAANVAELFSRRSADPYFSSILLQHDTVKGTVEAQRAVIKDLKAKGYRLGNLSECLGNMPVYRDENKVAMPNESISY